MSFSAVSPVIEFQFYVWKPTQMNEEKQICPHIVLIGDMMLESFTVMLKFIALSIANETMAHHVLFRLKIFLLILYNNQI